MSSCASKKSYNKINIIVDDTEYKSNITSKFNKQINLSEESEESEEPEKTEETEESEEPEDIEEKIEDEKEDNFENYIIPESMQQFTKNAKYCRFNWSGICTLNKWELQRKVDLLHATELKKAMQLDFKKHKEFIFYDPIHIGKKKGDSIYYVLDGQHRLEAYLYLYEHNKYPIQQIPAIIWYAENDEHFIELFNKINSRLSIDKLKLIQIKLLEIFEGMENKYGKNIWSINRPKINKAIFVEKLKNSDNVHKLSSDKILTKLFAINEQIRGKPRSLRVKPTLAGSIHNSSEILNLFLGLDKTMKWIDEI